MSGSPIVIAMPNSKGGTGKTTTAETLAVAAVAAGKRVALLDLNDDQPGSLTQWWFTRRTNAGGILENPILVRPDDTPEAISEVLAKRGIEILLIDTPPLDFDAIGAALDAADLALLPIRASAHEILAFDAAVEMCRTRGVPWAFVMVDTHRGKDCDKAAALLATAGRVLPCWMAHRASYMSAPFVGKAAAEIDKAAAKEAGELWSAVEAYCEEVVK